MFLEWRIKYENPDIEIPEKKEQPSPMSFRYRARPKIKRSRDKLYKAVVKFNKVKKVFNWKLLKLLNN